MPVMAFQATAPITAALLGFHRSGGLIGFPIPLDAAPGNPKQPGHFLGAVPIFSRRNDPLPQIATIGWHPFLYHILRQIK
jgi:hypothetical protein